MEAKPARWLCRPLKGAWFPLLSFPGTAVPGSGFFRPSRDWFAERFVFKSRGPVCDLEIAQRPR